MCGADWGVAEVGAAGPTFHPSADADSGFTVVAVERVRPKRRRRRLGG